ncbi:hypothetical protein FVEG_15759 [Fusarium verticillioides 7600]|uniref:Uncharacterized protein n=1 Tax=Gibberella moniliformis (strain M3125 / FGSC 7600) TaxID=334819 RepID=W7M021_GIBM7|nr:hypothetical protein FVEG_15759 [Fusarium verticillioides 7600]EWG44938.1 hypothetical protein FVEG_15759 [Fusarium verticillioides 7600]
MGLAICYISLHPLSSSLPRIRFTHSSIPHIRGIWINSSNKWHHYRVVFTIPLRQPYIQKVIVRNYSIRKAMNISLDPLAWASSATPDTNPRQLEIPVGVDRPNISFGK